MIDYRLFAFGAGALALALSPASALADKPDGDKPPHAKPSKPEGKPDHPNKPGHERHHGDDDGSHGKPTASGAPSGRGPDAPRPRRGDDFRNAMRELHEQLKAGTLKKEELKERLSKLRETASERSKNHRHELGKRWGGALAHPSAREELKHHARRMAMLNRAMVIAETEGKTDPKLVERISKLIDKENARHERAMARLQTSPPAGSAGPAGTPPAPTPSASGEAKGGQP